MHKNIIILLISFFSFNIFSQINAYYYQASFWSPSDGNYNEVYFSFEGKKLKYIKQENGMFRAAVDIFLSYSKNDSIIVFDKYTLKSPEVADTGFYIPNFIDVKRYLVQAGDYTFSIKISDHNLPESKIEYSEKITIPQYKALSFSDIELAERIEKKNSAKQFMKSGYTVIPYVSSFYPKNVKALKFYSELYLLDNSILIGEPVLLKYYLEPVDKSYVLSKYTKIKRIKAKNIMVLSGGFNIEQLPSGNYNLVLECINSNNELLASKKVFIQRSNNILKNKLGNVDSVAVENTFVESITDPDTLADYIKSLFPLMEPKQIIFAKNQLKSKNVRWMQKYFYSFWSDINPVTPELEWAKYKEQVDFVNKHFSTQIKRGYETDRGRIYLRYGTPDDIIKRDHPTGAYPYEIWHYIQTRNQGNIKVVFVNREFVGEDYELIYTNLMGEVSDPNWIKKVKKNDEIGNKRNFGNQIEDDFRNL